MSAELVNIYELSIDEVNNILSGLARNIEADKELIQKIHHQVIPQLNSSNENEDEVQEKNESSPEESE